MQALIKLFISIAILNKGPQDVPYSRFLFVSLLIVLFLIDVVFHQLAYASSEPPVDIAQSLGFIAVSYASVYTVIYVIMRAHGLVSRVVQTLTALVGVDLVVRCVQTPLMAAAVMFEQNQSLVLLLSFMYLLTIGWGLVIYVHVFKHALSISALRAALITLALFCLVLFIDYRFNPGGV